MSYGKNEWWKKNWNHFNPPHQTDMDSLETARVKDILPATTLAYNSVNASKKYIFLNTLTLRYVVS
jgi:hypothetical protein